MGNIYIRIQDNNENTCELTLSKIEIKDDIDTLNLKNFLKTGIENYKKGRK